MINNIDVGIITIRTDENTEILDRLPKTKILDGSDEMRYRITKMKSKKGYDTSIAVARCIEQGNIEAQRVATNLDKDLKPKCVLVVGIGGGLPHSDFSLGDVIVSSRVYDLTIEASKAGKKREYSIKGGVLHDLAKRVVQDIPAMIMNELSNWSSEIGTERPKIDLNNIEHNLTGSNYWKSDIRKSLIRHFSTDRRPLALPGAVASSDRLMKDPSITENWRNVARHVMAIDMELAGVCRSLDKIPVLGIRGISDIVGYKRDEIWTSYACKSAATFAVSLIQSGLLFFPKQTNESQESDSKFRLISGGKYGARRKHRITVGKKGHIQSGGAVQAGDKGSSQGGYGTNRRHEIQVGDEGAIVAKGDVVAGDIQDNKDMKS